MAYLVKRGCSTRARPDRSCQEFIDWRPGDIVEKFPDWVPVDEWVKDGVIAPIEPVAEGPAKRKGWLGNG